MVYYFRFECDPTEKNRYYGKAGCCFADIFVSDNDPEHAKSKALTCLSEWEWTTEGAVDARCIPELRPEWGESASEAYHRAVRFGIHAIFAAAPPEDHPDWPAMLVPPY